MKITIEDLFGKKLDHPDATEQRKANAEALLERVNDLLFYLEYTPPICPNTDTAISGSKGGSGDGGFRLQSSKTGAPNSSHKQGQAVDIYDPRNILDDTLTDELLENHELYREHPSATHGWCHLTTRAPRSGNRTFYP